jgi:hypothetical protein
MKVATLNNGFSPVDEKPSIGRRCYLGLSLLEKSMSGFKPSKDRLTIVRE